MKRITVFLVCAAAACAADFKTGQAARAVIGQETFTSQLDVPSDTVLGGVSGLAYAADTLFVADSNRVAASPIDHRVLLYKNISSIVPKPDADLSYTIKCPVCLGKASVVLGQPDFTTIQDPSTTTPATAPNQSNLRTPTAVASDGTHVVVADTDHNRVLIWNSIPSSNNQQADVVVGQADFKSAGIPPNNTPNAKSMRGPQGVWIQDGKLYVADTQNNRVLVYNRIPTSNGAAADVVVGQPDFTTFVEPDLTQQTNGATASNLLNPVAVTSDGIHLFVTDLGHNRVLVWNSIPSSNGVAADVVVGQPDMNSAIANNSYSVDSDGKQHKVLCDSTGTDSDGNPTYPPFCNSTLDFPRFALPVSTADGRQFLFIADGGNDRVLLFRQLPTTANGVAADDIIGQLGGDINQASDAADSLRTPMSLAWDGTNLYVSDAFNRRITVYSMGQTTVPYSGVRNAASLEIFAVGNVGLSGSITTNDTVTININNPATNAANCTTDSTAVNSTTPLCGVNYTYKIVDNDTFDSVVNGLVAAINAGSGDPNVIALANTGAETVVLTAREQGDGGNNIAYSTSVSSNATIVATAGGANLTGGRDAAQIGPGSLVTIIGDHLSTKTDSADLTQNTLPTTLGNTEVFFNGIRSPLLYVSPSQINAQIPWELTDTTSVNAYIRSVDDSGNVMVTTPVAVSIVTENPGIFTQGGSQDPRPGVIFHASSYATGVILVDGSIQANDVADVKIEDREYKYTVQSTDTLESVRDQLVQLINQDPKVTAKAGITFARNVQIYARIPGPEGNGIEFSSTTTNSNGSPTLVLTPTTTTLCCANISGSMVTDNNPAVPGETLYLFATGLGLPVIDDSNRDVIKTGTKYPANGPVTQPTNFVSSLAGGKTANILSAGLQPGEVGIFKVLFQLNSDMPTNPQTQMYIAQENFISNLVTFPVVSQTPPQ